MDIEGTLTKAHSSIARVAGAISLSIVSRRMSPVMARNWVSILRHVANRLETDFLSPDPAVTMADRPCVEVKE